MSGRPKRTQTRMALVYYGLQLFWSVGEGEMRTLRVSVRRLVEFLVRSGDIDAEGDWRNRVEAMQAGSDIHRTLQAAGGKAYQAEVPLACTVYFPDGAFSPHAARLDIREEAVRDQGGFLLCVEGRADGIVDDGAHPLVVDEIKGVSRDVSSLEEPAAVHEAQALCYAYLYLRRTRGASALSVDFARQVVVRLTYASMTTGEVRQIERVRAVPDVEAWFFSLLGAACRWAAWRVGHDEERERSLTSLSFPFVPRDGQRELADAVSRTIRKEGRLYAQAPTGSGKTVATLYPALKAMGSGGAARIAYLTAKTTTRRSALECLDLLRRQGLAANVLVVTAREKVCPLRREARDAAMRARPLASLCNPAECPLARGHYDAVNDALFEAITGYDVLDLSGIEAVAARHHVCPYELQREATRLFDVIVCDYHYAFAPSAGLFGLVDEPHDDGTILLVDEAHNLVERMREMYSAELVLSDLKGLEGTLRPQGSLSQLAKAVRAVIAAFPAWDKTLLPGRHQDSRGRGRRALYQPARIGDELSESLGALADGLDEALEAMSIPHASQAGAPAGAVETFLSLRDANLKLRAFLGALQRSEAGYVTYLSRDASGGRKLNVMCVNPSHDLEERLEQAKAAVFFSGTLLPMDYHRKLLAAQDADASVYVQSGFDHHLRVLIGTDVSARFSRRGPELYARVAAYLASLVRARPGNYLVFLPSYAMLGEVREALTGRMGGETEVVWQRPGMQEGERERFVNTFREARPTPSALVGLCVLGGVFGESIDLPGEALVGVVVVGTGLPRATPEREVIRDYFDAKKGMGFAYAYTYPGLVKVLQAAGRLIRTESDRGVVLLLDDRFLERELREAFPQEWKDVRTCTLETMPKMLHPE